MDGITIAADQRSLAAEQRMGPHARLYPSLRCSRHAPAVQHMVHCRAVSHTLRNSVWLAVDQRASHPKSVRSTDSLARGRWQNTAHTRFSTLAIVWADI